MPSCPYCGKESANRKDSACPKCGGAVILHDGMWYPCNPDSPALDVVKYFEGLVSERLSAEFSTDVHWTLPRKSAAWKREVATASRLLQDADDDLLTVLACLDLLFKGRDFAWRIRKSLLEVSREFSMALAIVKAKQAKQQAAAAKEEQAVNAVLRLRGDFFVAEETE